MHLRENTNLLTGLFAHQLGFINQEELISAFQHWANDKDKSVELLLLDKKLIDAESQQQIKSRVQQHLQSTDTGDLTAIQPVKKRAHGSVDPTSIPAENNDAHQSHQDTIPSPPMGPPTSRSGERSIESFRFTKLRSHATGGLGTVSIALDKQLNREVALKEIRREHAVSNKNRLRFLLEAEVTGGLEHPGIVPVYALGNNEAGQPYYAMRFIRGMSLRDAAKQFHETATQQRFWDYQSMEFRRMIRRLIDVCNAIEYAHSRSILHRDLKPANIMLGEFGETLVVDWGLAKSFTDSKAHRSNDDAENTPKPLLAGLTENTQDGNALGTPAFMSPEQANGQSDRLNRATDIYSLGGTLYYVLAGKTMDRSSRPGSVQKNAQSSDGPTERAVIESKLPPALLAVCRKAMAQQPGNRYARAVDLGNDLDLWLADEPLAVYREPAMIRLGRSFRRYRTAVISSLAVLLSTALILGITTVMIAAKNKDLQEARRQAEQNVATVRGLALSLLDRAEYHLKTIPGKEQQREKLMDQCFDVFTSIHAQDPTDPLLTEEYATVTRMSGNAKQLYRKPDAGRERLLLATRLFQSIDGYLENEELCTSLAGTYRDLGMLEKLDDQPDASKQAFANAKKVIVNALKQFPDATNLKKIEGTVELEKVRLYFNDENFEAALASSQNCLARFRPYVNQEPLNINDCLAYLAAAGRELDSLENLGKYSDADAAFKQHLPIANRLYKRFPQRTMQLNYCKFIVTAARGQLERGFADLIEWEKHLDTVKPVLERLDLQFIGSPYRFQRAESWRVRGLLRLDQGLLVEADSCLANAIALLETLVELEDGDVYAEALAIAQAQRANVKRRSNRNKEAIELLNQAIASQRKRAQKKESNKRSQTLLNRFLMQLKKLNSN